MIRPLLQYDVIYAWWETQSVETLIWLLHLSNFLGMDRRMEWNVIREESIQNLFFMNSTRFLTV